MVTIFNRRKLVLDSSSQEIARVRGILEDNKIEFLTVTKRNSNTVLDGNSAMMAASRGVGYSAMREPAKYTYYVYVKKQDYNRAVELV